MILKFFEAMNVTVENALFKRSESHLVKNESSPSKMQIYYCLVRKDQREFIKDMNVLPSKELSPNIND